MLDEVLVAAMDQALAGEKITASEAERIFKMLEGLRRSVGKNVAVTDEDRNRWKWEDEGKLDVDNDVECDGCSREMPGISFPIAANGNDRHAWVHR